MNVRGRFEAEFDSAIGDKPYVATMRVVAWDDRGEALVLSRSRLVRASDIMGFKGVSEIDEPIGLLPAGGWRVRWPNDDGSFDSEPIIGWLVETGGYARAIIPEEPGSGIPVDAIKGGEVYHTESTIK
jgi:hypothetical protein